jgi:hypothetical protein
MSLLLWILAVLIGIWGVVTLIRGQVLLGIILIIVAFLVGPMTKVYLGGSPITQSAFPPSVSGAVPRRARPEERR